MPLQPSTAAPAGCHCRPECALDRTGPSCALAAATAQCQGKANNAGGIHAAEPAKTPRLMHVRPPILAGPPRPRVEPTLEPSTTRPCPMPSTEMAGHEGHPATGRMVTGNMGTRKSCTRTDVRRGEMRTQSKSRMHRLVLIMVDAKKGQTVRLLLTAHLVSRHGLIRRRHVGGHRNRSCQQRLLDPQRYALVVAELSVTRRLWATHDDRGGRGA